MEWWDAYPLLLQPESLGGVRKQITLPRGLEQDS